MSADTRTLNLTLTLCDDLVASERPATEGGHESLDYIPGSMLLGATAARLYGGCKDDEAYRLFHSGALRFGDGVPLAGGAPCWPMPLCWHELKGLPATGEDERLAPDRMLNLQFEQFPRGEQAKQIRTGQVRGDGYRKVTSKALRMKTAIDPRTGRVAEAQLFGYEAIRAGQVFAARITADGRLPEALWKRVTELFAGPAEFLLGRSRSAEYGRVRIEPAAGDPPPPRTPARPGPA